ncbi:hypothetical protein [Saccharicrinis sp. GN24d3]
MFSSSDFKSLAVKDGKWLYFDEKGDTSKVEFFIMGKLEKVE